MQKLGWGEKMPGRGDQYFRVKQAGDQIRFRIAQPPVYTGKHFNKVTDPETGESKTDVIECPRINGGDDCETCAKFFELKAQEKRAKADGDEVAAKAFSNQARDYSPAVQFYFPVVNRDTEEFVVLQTTQGVRNKINEAAELGVDVMEVDWVLKNTGSKSPKDLYSLVRMDSKDTKDLTDKEMEALVKAQQYDLMSINEGQATSDEGIE